MAEQKPEIVNPADIPTIAAKPKGKAAIVKETERAPAGFLRFRIRSEHPQRSGPRYLVALTEQDAKTEFCRVSSLKPEEAGLVVTALPD